MRPVVPTPRIAPRPVGFDGVTGTVLVPNSPWVGLGTRPVIGYAPGTQGMADRCAPSRQLQNGTQLRYRQLIPVEEQQQR